MVEVRLAALNSQGPVETPFQASRRADHDNFKIHGKTIRESDH